MKRVDAGSYLVMAEEYWASAHLLRPSLEHDQRAAFYMMACHSMELSMKAVLLVHGAGHEWIMMKGHNIDRCLAEAVEGGLKGCPEDLASHIANLSYAHSVQAFRYPISWDFELPDPDETMTSATKLLRLAQDRVSELSGVAAALA